MIALQILNTVAALAGIYFAATGGLAPGSLSDSEKPSEGERFFGWMYAVRGIPLGVAAGLAPLFWDGPGCVLVLGAAAAAQVGDAAIGVWTRKWTMIAGASFATVIHVITAVAVR